MIAVDTSVLVDHLKNEITPAVRVLRIALIEDKICVPPPVVAELLSEPTEPAGHRHWVIKQFAMLEVLEGYWERAGLLRATALRQKRKARLGDALIAQSCIDHGVPLLTSDLDFRHYVKAGGLKLVK